MNESINDDVAVSSLAITKKAEPFLAVIGSLHVENALQYAEAAEYLKTVKAFRRQVKLYWEKPKRLADQAHDDLCAKEAAQDAPLKRAEEQLKSGMADYYAEQERIRREDQLRREAEEKRKAEDAKIAEAALAESLGDNGAAKAILDEEIILAPVVAPPAVQKQAGISVRESWGAEVFDFKALVAAVAAGVVPLAAIQANDKFLGQQARSLKSELHYPGVKTTCQKTISAAVVK